MITHTLSFPFPNYEFLTIELPFRIIKGDILYLDEYIDSKENKLSDELLLKCQDPFIVVDTLVCIHENHLAEISVVLEEKDS